MISIPSRAILIFGVAIAAVACTPRPAETPPEPAPSETVSQPFEAVAALGQLEPEGDVRKLAGPSASRALSPRITDLLVDEGEMVTRGQVLARFDNSAGLHRRAAKDDDRAARRLGGDAAALAALLKAGKLAARSPHVAGTGHGTTVQPKQ